MSKFKVGQKVYSIRHGLGLILQIQYPSMSGTYIRAEFPEIDLQEFCIDGKVYSTDINPTLLTLEEARAKGYDVPKQKTLKEKVVYINYYEEGRNVLGAHHTEQEAKTCADKNAALVIAYPVTIKYEIEE